MIKKLKNHLPAILLLIVFGLLGSKALFKPGFYTSHDGEHQLVRQYIFNRAITYGQIPPRFDRQLMKGIGYPLFTFTYQLPFWIGEVFILLGYSTQAAIKGVFILTYIASGLAMYLFTQEKWGKLAGFLSAFLYLWAPFRFLEIFVRASLGSHTALIFIPLLFWSFNQSVNKPKRIIVGGISIAGLLLSHSMVAQMSAMAFALFYLAKLFDTKTKKALIAHTIKVGLLGLGLSAFYLLPAFIYQGSIQGLNRTFYAEHFVTLKQLIYSKWGYAFSQIGTVNDGMSFQIGIAQWLVVGISALVLIKNLLTKALKTSIIEPMFILAAFILAVFLMTQPSSKIWEIGVRKWLIIDIPWRFLSITTFTTAVLAGYLVQGLKIRLFKISLIFFLIAVALYTNRNHLRVNKYISFDNSWFKDYSGTSNSYDEYKPVATPQELLDKQDFSTTQVLSGNADIEVIKDLPHQLDLSVKVNQRATIKLNTVYFPGWQLYINNQQQDIKNLISGGLPTLDLRPGEYHINLNYKQTKLMKLSNSLSLLSLGLILVLAYLPKAKKYA